MIKKIHDALITAFWKLLFVALLIGGGAAVANYKATVPGSGTDFGSLVVAAVHYVQMFVCDPTTPANCSSVGTYGTAPGAVNALNVNAAITNGNTNGSKTSANSAPVVIASDQTAADPCMFQAKSNFAISTASGTFALVAGVSAKKIYVCSLSLIAPSAVSVSLAEGSSATCGTSAQAAVIGVATNGTAANGMALPANGGLTLGNGQGTVAATATAANALCLFQSGTAQLAGNLTYVQQ